MIDHSIDLQLISIILAFLGATVGVLERTRRDYAEPIKELKRLALVGREKVKQAEEVVSTVIKDECEKDSLDLERISDAINWLGLLRELRKNCLEALDIARRKEYLYRSLDVIFGIIFIFLLMASFSLPSETLIACIFVFEAAVIFSLNDRKIIKELRQVRDNAERYFILQWGERKGF